MRSASVLFYFTVLLQEKYERIGSLKMTLPLEEVCRDAPVFLRQLLACTLLVAVVVAVAVAVMTTTMMMLCLRFDEVCDWSVADALNLGFEEEPDYAMMRGMCRCRPRCCRCHYCW